MPNDLIGFNNAFWWFDEYNVNNIGYKKYCLGMLFSLLKSDDSCLG